MDFRVDRQTGIDRSSQSGERFQHHENSNRRYDRSDRNRFNDSRNGGERNPNRIPCNSIDREHGFQNNNRHFSRNQSVPNNDRFHYRDRDRDASVRRYQGTNRDEYHWSDHRRKKEDYSGVGIYPERSNTPHQTSYDFCDDLGTTSEDRFQPPPPIISSLFSIGLGESEQRDHYIIKLVEQIESYFIESTNQSRNEIKLKGKIDGSSKRDTNPVEKNIWLSRPEIFPELHHLQNQWYGLEQFHKARTLANPWENLGRGHGYLSRAALKLAEIDMELGISPWSLLQLNRDEARKWFRWLPNNRSVEKHLEPIDHHRPYEIERPLIASDSVTNRLTQERLDLRTQSRFRSTDSSSDRQSGVWRRVTQIPFTFVDICGAPGSFTQFIQSREKCAFGFGVSLKTSHDLDWEGFEQDKPVMTDEKKGNETRGSGERRDSISRSGDPEALDWQRFRIYQGEDGDLFRCCLSFEDWTRSCLAHLQNFPASDKRDQHSSVTWSEGVDLVMADGGIDSPNSQTDCQQIEDRMLSLMFRQAYLGITLTKTGGTFVLKMFDTLGPGSALILFIISLFFDQIRFIKPRTSRPANSEKYLVASKRHSRESRHFFLGRLLVCIRLWIKQSDDLAINGTLNDPAFGLNFNVCFNDSKCKKMTEFNNWLTRVNDDFLKQQMFYCNRTIQFIHILIQGYPIPKPVFSKEYLLEQIGHFKLPFGFAPPGSVLSEGLQESPLNDRYRDSTRSRQADHCNYRSDNHSTHSKKHPEENRTQSFFEIPVALTNESDNFDQESDEFDPDTKLISDVCSSLESNSKKVDLSSPISSCQKQNQIVNNDEATISDKTNLRPVLLTPTLLNLQPSELSALIKMLDRTTPATVPFLKVDPVIKKESSLQSTENEAFQKETSDPKSVRSIDMLQTDDKIENVGSVNDQPDDVSQNGTDKTDVYLPDQNSITKRKQKRRNANIPSLSEDQQSSEVFLENEQNGMGKAVIKKQKRTKKQEETTIVDDVSTAKTKRVQSETNSTPQKRRKKTDKDIGSLPTVGLVRKLKIDNRIDFGDTD